MNTSLSLSFRTLPCTQRLDLCSIPISRIVIASEAKQSPSWKHCNLHFITAGRFPFRVKEIASTPSGVSQ